VDGNVPSEAGRVAAAPVRGCLRISIVCYASDEAQLEKTLATLLESCRQPLASGRLVAADVLLVDNGPAATERAKIERLIAHCAPSLPAGVRMLRSGDGSNRGFGAGHNLAFDAAACEFHLVLNPDVELAGEALAAALAFMDEHAECGLLAPAITGDAGEPQYLCKRYPSVFDLLLRGFAPRWLRARFAGRLARYEMRDAIADRVVWQPPIVSGCFMLLRSSLLRQLRGFDPSFFLYFEDFDLSLRAAAWTRIAYVPAVRVVHHGGFAASKGMRHILLFARSAITFFNRHGWKWS
jgi:GT2 family glycosyltransferase